MRLSDERAEFISRAIVQLRMDAVKEGTRAGMTLCTPGKTVPCGKVCRTPKNCKKGSKGRESLSKEAVKTYAEAKRSQRQSKNRRDRPKTIEFDTSAKPLKTQKELQSQAEKLTPILKGKSVSYSDGGITYNAILKGVRVADTGTRKLLIADIESGEALRQNGDSRPFRGGDTQMARRLYTRAAGLPDDSLIGGQRTVRKVSPGQSFATTSSGVVSVTPGKRVTENLGKQAIDYPFKG